MIGIIGAMEEEVADLKKMMIVHDTVEQASMTFFRGMLCEREVVIVQSGIGKVNAAICAQILIDKFGVDTLINTGVAGSLNAEINIGDMVISSDAVHHDMDTSVFGDPVGQVPRMDTFAFPADEALVELTRVVNEEVNPDIGTFVGRVVSGDQFISSQEKKEQLVRLFGGYCAEMEGAAIAHTAYVNDVSYVIIRAISDKADNSSHMDYPEFARRAIDHSMRLLVSLIPRIS
ncbi:5'-methylthioadenosine/adenosylhomocysteine nucleosidase [Hespellia stercorisuis]|uniref:adenosylhomocysteine nucleosidase n=1 Tax=Hespellia stercorisuis DSM 15480 TaxID=1121950 RepID=A0A1M6JF98_9FIRM|nr:5'-methylthioadenosine/adenosylhomocysteine nucleosidase [Hespellia stercorisuis]SHJ45344.1 methylthioadenosine nucleosidase [Hespellia stercorisuis DSM 15480]